jgi:aminoglycoside phosphotransferase (APT) family kinase protein
VPTPVRQLCVLLRDGRVLTDERGRLPSYDAADEWDDLGVRARICGDPAAVLIAPQTVVGEDPRRMLNVFASRTDVTVDGRWASLDDVVEDDPATIARLRAAVAEVDGLLATPERRPAWFRRGWYDEVDAWIDAELAGRGRARTGPTVPRKVWSFSAVLEVPADPTPVWFKGSSRHFHAEPALTRLVAGMLPEHAPPLIAVDEDRGWLLMEEMAGADEEQAEAPPTGLGVAAGRIAATLHLRSLDHLEDIEALGVPVRGVVETMHAFDEVLATSVELDQLTAEELAAARGARDDLRAAADELASMGLPETLIHGDLHPGNVALDGDSLVLYDWSDAAVSHPLLDLAHLSHRLPDDEAAQAHAAYAEVWRSAYPDVDYDRALLLAAHVNAAFQVVSYEQIYRAQEDASYWETKGVVARILRTLPERFRPSGPAAKITG